MLRESNSFREKISQTTQIKNKSFDIHPYNEGEIISPSYNKNIYDGQRSASIKVIGQNRNVSNRSSLVIHNIALAGNANGIKEKNTERDHFKTLEYENHGKRTNEILE